MSTVQQSRYILECKVGSGVYGDVYKGRNAQTGQVVAIKKIKKHEGDQGISTVALRETSILKTVRHPNVVNLLDIEMFNGGIRLVMEYLEQDLEKYLRSQINPIPESTIKDLMFGIVSGVGACHNMKCMHRDLKPQNILLSSDGIAKVGDFGMARTYQKQLYTYSQEVITLWYRPPELLLGTSCYSTAVDVWSLGCIFGQIIMRKPVFPGDSEIQQLKLISNSLTIKQGPNQRNAEYPMAVQMVDGVQQTEQQPTQSNRNPYHETLSNPVLQSQLEETLRQKLIGYSVSLECQDLLFKMLQLNPDNRITCQQALQHPYFNKPVQQPGLHELEQMNQMKSYFKLR